MHKVPSHPLPLVGLYVETDDRNPVNQGLYDRLPNYIMQQRHFYPLSPARSEARVAIQESGLGEFVGGTPDILILPSELQYFAKVAPLPHCTLERD